MFKDLQNIPAFKSAIYLIIGILAGTIIYLPPLIPLIIIVIISILTIITLNRFPISRVNYYLPIILIAIFGFFRADISYNIISENNIALIPDTPEGSKYKLTGVINDIPDIDSNKVRFNVDVSRIDITEPVEAEGEVIVTINKSRYKEETPLPDLKAGDEVVVEGRVVTPWGKRNPGEFDYREYLKDKNIYKNFLAYGYDNIEVLSSDNLSFWETNIIFPTKYYAINNIDKNISGDEGAYLKGLITGQRNDISPETKQAFINAGVMHLIAVSGLNVAYVIIIIVTLLSIFRIYFWKRTILVITALVFYCIFTGSSPSIVRATIMGILLLAAYASERKTNFYNIVGFSAFVILIFNPRQLYDPSFILSYTAVLSMVILYEKMKPVFIDKLDLKEYRYGRVIKGFLILFVTTIAAQIGVLPVAGSYFEKVSVISIFANLVVVPIANLSLGIGFMQIIAGVFSEFLSSLIAQTNLLLLSFQLWFIKTCASVDFAYFETYSFDLFNIIFYFAVITVILTTTSKNFRQRIVLVFLIMLSASVYNIDTESKFRVAFLDVGKGNSSVIETSDGKVILINTGLSTQTYNSSERTIIPYLKRRGIDKIDLLILTDDDKNSTGGYNHLKQNFEIENIISGNQIDGTTVSEGDLVDSFNDIRIYFLSPVNKYSNKVALKISYRDLDILFIPSQNETEWNYLVKKYENFINSDVIYTNYIYTNLQNPQILISPTNIQTKLNEVPKSKKISTNNQGAFIIESTGENIEIIDWK